MDDDGTESTWEVGLLYQPDAGTPQEALFLGINSLMGNGGPDVEVPPKIELCGAVQAFRSDLGIVPGLPGVVR